MRDQPDSSTPQGRRRLFPWLLYGYALLCTIFAFWTGQKLLWALMALGSLALASMLYHGAARRTGASRTRESAGFYDALLHHNPNAIGVIDSGGSFKRVNATAEKLLGYSELEMLGQPLHAILAFDRSDKVQAFFAELSRGAPVSVKTTVQHKEGYRVDLDVTAVPFNGGQGDDDIMLICQDITASMRTEEQIRHLAYYDDMTGLPNRRLFVQSLNQAIARAVKRNRMLAVFFVDLDRFKMVNDSFGHDYGDMLLLQVAERITRSVTEKDFAARTEGDEFALYYTDIHSIENVAEIAEGIYKELEEPFMLEQYQLHVTASIGIALLSEDEEDAAALMKCADIALTRAKEKGKSNYQVFNSDMKSVSLKRLTLENELRKAFAREELMLHYQPQMEISTGRIVGFEALVRWRHPERGMIPPMDFIPFAEESGLIVPIGEWVMKEACRQNRRWQTMGFAPVPIAVNLSTRQFLQHDLPDKIARVLQETGLPPELLELEITESSTMDVDYVSELLQSLKKLGVKISIDDFGTGYSSLYYLKRFPIDKLKIDQSFVRDIMTDPNDAAIVASIIAMTRHLNLRVIAEGVETREQLDYLYSNHCNEIQGYWFSPPLEAGQAERLLLQQNAAAASVSESAAASERKRPN
ncbi:EAL domain-containing protein [Paenibacillus sp. GD4]|uniref:putative bifunctional diguanylate cyclase/phosphodiesterase n=1 Tax=Paenibacillus sp. GD4 TaxID=3068890 RepID=UPI002796B1FD|nr:EAL domain-containing protein [Paenibacillus sp. GD4]MDQ1910093.1 EAL domain-containing protein [Paenibacillus sp. GD4]